MLLVLRARSLRITLTRVERLGRVISGREVSLREVALGGKSLGRESGRGRGYKSTLGASVVHRRALLLVLRRSLGLRVGVLVQHVAQDLLLGVSRSLGLERVQKSLALFLQLLLGLGSGSRRDSSRL